MKIDKNLVFLILGYFWYFLHIKSTFVQQTLNSKKQDAQIIFWTSEDDLTTALETIEERCLLAFSGVPNETRKAMEDGTTIFERVLPGADRMYPDTDSAPISIEDKYIDEIGNDLPIDLSERYKQMVEWGLPPDTYTYILRNNLIPAIEKIVHAESMESAISMAKKRILGDFNLPKTSKLFIKNPKGGKLKVKIHHFPVADPPDASLVIIEHE